MHCLRRPYARGTGAAGAESEWTALGPIVLLAPTARLVVQCLGGLLHTREQASTHCSICLFKRLPDCRLQWSEVRARRSHFSQGQRQQASRATRYERKDGRFMSCRTNIVCKIHSPWYRSLKGVSPSLFEEQIQYTRAIETHLDFGLEIQSREITILMEPLQMDEMKPQNNSHHIQRTLNVKAA